MRTYAILKVHVGLAAIFFMTFVMGMWCVDTAGYAPIDALAWRLFCVGIGLAIPYYLIFRHMLRVFRGRAVMRELGQSARSTPGIPHPSHHGGSRQAISKDWRN